MPLEYRKNLWIYLVVGVLAGFTGFVFSTLLRARADRRPAENLPAAHEEEEHEGVRLSVQEMEEFGIDTAVAGPGVLRFHRDVPGEVVVDPNRLVHIVPRVSGIVAGVHKNIGEAVRAGELVAVVESRELADLRAAYLERVTRLELARATYRREERLWREKKISSEREYLEARQAYEAARIALRAAEQKLLALGFTKEAVEGLVSTPEENLARYELSSPSAGVVIDKHAVRGELLAADAVAFTVADFSTVWVELTVYPRDVSVIRPGMQVTIDSGWSLTAEGTIDYVTPTLSESLRTARARVVLSNPDNAWRPGMFVTGHVLLREEPAEIVVPATAIQTMGGRPVVFVWETDKGFVPRQVRIGRRASGEVEILEGLEAGERYAARGAFTVKAEIEKSAYSGSEHSH